MITLKTPRLILRPWREEDFEPFAQLNADPRVMEHFPALLSKEESDQMVKRIQANEKDWGLWAVSVPGVAAFIGFIGLNQVTFTAPFTPAVEVGWRLAFDYWGKGYATEALRRIQGLGHDLGLKRMSAQCHPDNVASRHVLEKCGFTLQRLQNRAEFPNLLPAVPVEVLSYSFQP